MQADSKNTKIVQDSRIAHVIPQIVHRHVEYLCSEIPGVDNNKKIYNALRKLLNGHFEKYIFSDQSSCKTFDEKLTEDEFQKILSTLNEKQSVRKANGVYYTPKDVIDFIVCNCLALEVQPNVTSMVSSIDTLDWGSITNWKTHDLAYNKTVLDPTCGSGEFLMSVFQSKIEILKRNNNSLSDIVFLRVLDTIYGNDINIESIEICKIRLFFEAIKYIEDPDNYEIATEILNKNLSNHDFVNIDKKAFDRYDIIVGNPPYVEDCKSNQKPLIPYGNIYANVIHNSIECLKAGGTLGFIIPISYVSTPRMAKIRKIVEQSTSAQYILNYADRPDCLFTTVHQKLSILFAKKENATHSEAHRVYTSGYNYWYKSEREHLFSKNAIFHNEHTNREFYPKIGNETENAIFSKVYTDCGDSLMSRTLPNDAPNVFLNMRATFWIKAFSFNPGSKEYKGFAFSDDERAVFLCLLNSSLFFLYWITVSDCWHITLKDLRHFRAPDATLDLSDFQLLASKLESELEHTKVYIGTKQTAYEYKHKLCKQTIDDIDEHLAALYGLTTNEITYIKNYAEKYRRSLGG